jgi:predicted DCC family thiol-disulfide oxidoreductase YuxK
MRIEWQKICKLRHNRKLKMAKKSGRQYIILFDGTCKLCNNVVRFITKNDSRKIFCFVPLESEKATEYLNLYNKKNVNKGSVLLIQDEKIYTKSNAVLHILKYLDGLWPLFYIFIVVPGFIRDPVYDVIAKYRYRWFGTVKGDPHYRSCQD